jgi:hypothetical protein
MELTPTLNQLAFTILNTVRSKTNSNEPISLRLIKFEILAVRSFLIRQEANKNYIPDPLIIQTLGAVPVEQVNSMEYFDTIPEDCKILRTKEKIPSFIETSYSQLCTRVGSVSINQKPFSLITYARVPYFNLNKFTKNRTGAFIHNGYMWFIGPKSLELDYVNIQGVFENPEDAAHFLTFDGKPCYTDDKAFPIKYSMIPLLTEIVISKFIALQAKAPQDFTNDGVPNFVQTTTNKTT